MRRFIFEETDAFNKVQMHHDAQLYPQAVWQLLKKLLLIIYIFRMTICNSTSQVSIDLKFDAIVSFYLI